MIPDVMRVPTQHNVTKKIQDSCEMLSVQYAAANDDDEESRLYELCLGLTGTQN